MTDLIHERHQDAPAVSAPPPAPAEPELDEKTGQKRVYGYIFILFVVAFSLLVWAFFMNQRSTDEVLSELRGSAGALQSTLDRNMELEKRVEEMENELDELTEKEREKEREIARLKDEISDEKQRAAARGLLWLLEYRFKRGEYDLCREVCADMEPLRAALQTEGSATRPSELARYEEIAAALGEVPAENP